MRFLHFTLALLFAYSVCAQLTARQKKRYQELDKIEQEHRQNNWPPPPNPDYEENTLGFELNNYFEQHGISCGFGSTNPNGNYIPSGFIPRVQLNHSVTKIPIGGEYLLLYLFKTSQVENWDSFTKNFTVFQGNRIVKLNLEKFKINPAQGIPSAYLSKSCSGFYNTQAKLNGEAKPPLFSLEAAVNAEVNSQKQGTIVAVMGDFSSPLSDLFETHSTEGLALNASLWKHYTLFPEDDNNLFYLNNFQGVHVKRFSQQTDLDKFGGELKYGFNGFLKLDGKREEKREVRNLFEANDWSTLITSDLSSMTKRNNHFRSVKNVEEVLRYFNNHVIHGVPNPNDPVMAQGKKHQVVFKIPGLPQRLSENYWTTLEWDSAVYQSKPVVVESKYAPEINGCIIVLEGKPNKKIFSDRKTSVTTNIKLKGNTENSLDNKRLTLNGSVVIPTSVEPILLMEEFARPYSTHGNGETQDLEWLLDLRIIDENNPIDWAKEKIRVRSEGFKIDGNEQEEIENITFLVNGVIKSRSNRLVQLKVETNNNFPLGKFDPNLKEFTYRAQLILELPLKDGGIAEKPISAIISFPKIKASENSPVMIEQPTKH